MEDWTLCAENIINNDNDDTTMQNQAGGFVKSDPNHVDRDSISSEESADEGPVVLSRKRIQQFSDSDSESGGTAQRADSKNEKPMNSDVEKDDSDTASETAPNKSQQPQPTSYSNRKVIRPFFDSESDADVDNSKLNNVPNKSFISKVASDSDSDKFQDNLQESRIKNKRNKLKEKFQSLLTSRSKDNDFDKNNKCNRDENSVRAETKTDNEHSDSGKSSDENDGLSIEKMKQKMKEKTMQLKTTLYDPDTSDEESHIKQLPKQKKSRKSTKLTSPKPQRMSAKQAMENMQKIKSESNRMLRESDVSLPYHRPKALSLKDILSRRKPAVAADGKALPIKMNEDQLKHYVQLLEERQKEMIELCKSESEDEEITDSDKNDIRRDGSNTDEIQVDNEEEPKTIQNDNNEKIESCDTNNKADVSLQNDSLFDDLSVETTKKVNSEQKKTETEENHGDVPTTEPNINEMNFSSKDTSYNTEDRIDTENYDTGKKQNCANDSVELIDEQQRQCKLDLHATDAENKDQETENVSADISLVYNDSIEEQNNASVAELTSKTKNEEESQCISLHYDNSEKVVDMDKEQVIENLEPKQKKDSDLVKLNSATKSSERVVNKEIEESIEHIETEQAQDTELAKESEAFNKNDENEFSDDDINMDDIDALIENAEVIASQNCPENVSSPMLIKDFTSKSNPKLTGAPGMIIDLDGTDPLVPKKLNGVELLKERFFYFAKLKTPEELEREKEKRIKPGTQHLKLKQELEEQIAEQRSLEWAKRLEEEKQNKKELDAVRGDASDVEEDIDEIEAKLKENEENVEKEISESEEGEEEEEEQEIIDKPRKKNPMVDDEAKESDCDEVEDQEVDGEEQENNENDADVNNDVDEREDADDEEDDDSEESSDELESENEEQKLKKGRILKAFEDSDDEEVIKVAIEETKLSESAELHKENQTKTSDKNTGTQDDEIQLAQLQKSFSDDLFTSQASTIIPSSEAKQTDKVVEDSQEQDFKTQTFSILEASTFKEKFDLTLPDKINMCDTQSYDDNLDKVVGMCSGSFSQSQNLVTPIHDSDVPVSQIIGDDVLELCTGKFYDNQFVSQVDNENKASQDDMNTTNVQKLRDTCDKNTGRSDNDNIKETNQTRSEIRLYDKEELAMVQKKTEDSNLKCILDELNDPEFDTPKPNKYFVGDDGNKENKMDNGYAQTKKRFLIDSDDDGTEEVTRKKKKKLKKKKPEKRALQISDDEEEQSVEEADEFESEIEENGDKVFEYDSEENEVVVQPLNPKKKRKMAEFFENEAELTSEDEWIGSGDEDEAGLDRMEREAGDDETFNQNKLQRELGQIHMRDVLDQDKREVRLIQELLFEDGDLGGGHRQRKFRWRDAGEEEPGMPYDELADTQEEEFESEEQWRKQRHEREMFLKQLKEQEQPEEALNVSVNRTSIIKANLSKNTTNLFEDINTSIETTEAVVIEKKAAKDVPSPKKPFTIFQQNYHGSLLTRGRGALARLAALATPLAIDDDDVPKASLGPSSKRNFVFTALDKEVEQDPKVTKRKADSNLGTPRLVKKMRAEEKQKYKSSLLDHLKS